MGRNQAGFHEEVGLYAKTGELEFRVGRVHAGFNIRQLNDINRLTSPPFL